MRILSFLDSCEKNFSLTPQNSHMRVAFNRATSQNENTLLKAFLAVSLKSEKRSRSAAFLVVVQLAPTAAMTG